MSTKTKEWDMKTRRRIIYLRRVEKRSYEYISISTGVPTSTIYSLCKKYKETGTSANRKRSGRPCSADKDFEQDEDDINITMVETTVDTRIVQKIEYYLNNEPPSENYIEIIKKIIMDERDNDKKSVKNQAENLLEVDQPIKMRCKVRLAGSK